jgi:single-strand DNA-binding protein
MDDMNYNKLILAGRLTRDPEKRTTSGGTLVVNFGIAVNRKSKSGSEWVDKVTFVDVSMFGKRAESFAQYHAKGDACHLEGHLEMDEWEDKATGAKRTKLKMVAEEWVFTDRARSGDEGAQGGATRVKSFGPSSGLPSADDTPF